MPIALVQISDLHLGRGFGGLGVSEAVRTALAEAGLAALRSACALATQRSAVAVLVPGDLFDRAEIDEERYRAVREVFASFARPVLVSPGNHDVYGPMSVWNTQALAHLGLPAWPDNVHVFSTRRLTPHVLCDGALAVYGHRVEGYHQLTDTPLLDVQPVDGPRWHVLSFHGGLGAAGVDRRGTVPFTAAQLAAVGTDYAAVGHYHRHSRIEHEGRLLGAYAGTPVPGEWDEDPHGGVLVVTLDDGPPQIEFHNVHAGRIARLEVHADAPLDTPADAVALIRLRVAAAGLGSADIVGVTLTGLCRGDLDVSAVTDALVGEFRHMVVTDATEPEAPSTEPAARTTVESDFVARMDAAAAKCDDADERRVLADARRYGLLALRGRAVRPPAALAMEAGDTDAD